MTMPMVSLEEVFHRTNAFHALQVLLVWLEDDGIPGLCHGKHHDTKLQVDHLRHGFEIVLRLMDWELEEVQFHRGTMQIPGTKVAWYRACPEVSFTFE